MSGFLLDTVVVSELRKGARAESAVITWQATVAATPAYISVITLLEIRIGLRRVAARDPAFAAQLEAWYSERLLPRFRAHLLPVDQAVAEAAAELSAARTLSPHDALLAATALVNGLTLATRNVADFAGTGIIVVNPWDKIPSD